MVTPISEQHAAGQAGNVLFFFPLHVKEVKGCTAKFEKKTTKYRPYKKK